MLTQRPCLQAPLPADESAPAGTGPASRPAPAVLDRESLARLAELDPKGENQLLERVFKAFDNSTKRLMPQLLDGRRSADLQAVARVAHTLKSSSASIGALRLSALCIEVETHLQGHGLVGLDPHVDALVAEVEIVLQALQQELEAKP